jgi:hypothetical protein
MPLDDSAARPDPDGPRTAAFQRSRSEGRRILVVHPGTESAYRHGARSAERATASAPSARTGEAGASDLGERGCSTPRHTMRLRRSHRGPVARATSASGSGGVRRRRCRSVSFGAYFEELAKVSATASLMGAYVKLTLRAARRVERRLSWSVAPPHVPLRAPVRGSPGLRTRRECGRPCRRARTRTRRDLQVCRSPQ